jgi:hypothetical protein
MALLFEVNGVSSHMVRLSWMPIQPARGDMAGCCPGAEDKGQATAEWLIRPVNERVDLTILGVPAGRLAPYHDFVLGKVICYLS